MRNLKKVLDSGSGLGYPIAVSERANQEGDKMNVTYSVEVISSLTYAKLEEIVANASKDFSKEALIDFYHWDKRIMGLRVIRQNENGDWDEVVHLGVIRADDEREGHFVVNFQGMLGVRWINQNYNAVRQLVVVSE